MPFTDDIIKFHRGKRGELKNLKKRLTGGMVSGKIRNRCESQKRGGASKEVPKKAKKVVDRQRAAW